MINVVDRMVTVAQANKFNCSIGTSFSTITIIVNVVQKTINQSLIVIKEVSI